MYFSNIAMPALVALSSTVLAAPTANSRRALTAQQMVDNINKITAQSQSLEPIVAGIQTAAKSKRQVADPDDPFNAVTNAFSDMTTEVTADDKGTGSQPTFNATDATMVCNAYTKVSIPYPKSLCSHMESC